MARPSIADVAQAAGVSKGAVSFALNNKPGVAAETRERILRVAEELGWTPSARARALSVSKALAVGLVIARPPETLGADPFFPVFIAGVEATLTERGYSLLLHMVTDPEKQFHLYRRLSNEGRVDGVFVTDLHVDDARPAFLAELGLPAVIVGPADEKSACPGVGIDDAPGIHAAVQHLLDLGHTRIAHVSGPVATVHGRSRVNAWKATLKSSGLRPGPCVEADFSAESGVRATRKLLEMAHPPTAIVYANDLMAMAGLSWATSRGVRVPRDLSITGYDDTEIAAHLEPSLTTVRTDVLGWGRAAAQRLLEVIAQDDHNPLELPPAQLVVRRSTGPAPTRLPSGPSTRPARARQRTEKQ